MITKQERKEEVISAWYMDDSKEDQRLPHHRNPKQFVSLDKLSGTWKENYNIKWYFSGIHL